MTPDALATLVDLELFPYQRKYLEAVAADRPRRTCLYYRTGAGKSFTSLAGMKLQGMEDVCVIAPPSTHKQWQVLAGRLGMDILCLSHAKFRMKGTKLSRHMPVIADEFHLFGGQKGQGWRKLDQLAMHLQAPLVLMSATPNYNDAERVYCVQHILDPAGTKGGYLQFLYQHCDTEQSYFGVEPKVIGFKNHKDAAEFLASLPHVYHLPDERVVDIIDIKYDPSLPAELEEYRYNRRDHRMFASRIEQWHAVRLQGLIDERGFIRGEVMEKLIFLLDREGSILIYANHAKVALALASTFEALHIDHLIVTGLTSKQVKDRVIHSFNYGWQRILIGTASLATGTDGMDRVCNTLIILDDTDDEALRRQLIGRILPRGELVPINTKEVLRFVPD